MTEKKAKKKTAKPKLKKKSAKKAAKKTTKPRKPSASPPAVKPNKEEVAVIKEACGNDPKVVEFFLMYLQKRRNATEAYLALRPGLDRKTAKTLGSRMLSKVDRTLLMDSYGIGIEKYLAKIEEGLEAHTEVTNGSGKNKKVKKVPDHATQREYHRVQGELLGLETKKGAPQVGIQINANQAINKTAEKYGF